MDKVDKEALEASKQKKQRQIKNDTIVTKDDNNTAKPKGKGTDSVPKGK